MKQNRFQTLGLGCAILAFLTMMGCHNRGAVVESYRPDELALLKLATEDALNLERQKDYGTLYDAQTSSGFRQRVDRRHFLMMSGCVEDYLGGVVAYSHNMEGFKRRRSGKLLLDEITLKVERGDDTISERFVFTGDGSKFRLHGLQWAAESPRFLKCMEAVTQPTPPATVPASPPSP